MKNKRVCFIHGGKSTGPRTQKGLQRSKKANWKHGAYSQESKKERQEILAVLEDVIAVHNKLLKDDI